MKNLKLITIGALFFVFFSCQKNDLDNLSKMSEIEFNISHLKQAENSNNGISLKSTSVIDDAETIVVTIQNFNGEPTDYTSERININRINNNYFSEKISLVTGDYQLTEFLLLDADDNTIYATPVSGSLQAQNIDNPLSFDFSIIQDQITSVSVEVLSTENLTPEDFGLVGIQFFETPTFSFLINVSEIGQSDSLITSLLTVTKDAYTYSQELEAIANNVVTIKDGLSDYTITITKEGYGMQSINLSNDSLKYYSTTPLTIELEAITGIVTDIDGNVYKTIKIGDQWWMAENLRTTKYNDGTDIPLVSNDASWSGLSTPGFCWYNNDQVTYGDTYGAFYNWHTVNTGNLAPTGWHVPTEEEWNTLIAYLGGESEAGGKLKEIGTIHWNSPNAGATNESGFTALPAGRRATPSVFDYMGNFSNWWSASEYSSASDAWFWDCAQFRSSVFKGHIPKTEGLSVRCIKD